MLLCLLFAIVLFLLFLPKVYFKVTFTREDGENKVEVSIKYLKFIKLSHANPIINIKKKENGFGYDIKFDKKIDKDFNIVEEKKNNKKKKKTKNDNPIEDVLQVIHEYNEIYRKNINMDLWDVEVAAGMEDAAMTAVSCGIINSLFYSSISILKNYFNIEKFNINVTPIYNKKVLFIKSTSIFSFTVGNIIYVKLRKTLHKFKSHFTNSSAGYFVN